MDETGLSEAAEVLEDAEAIEPFQVSFLSWIIESLSGPLLLLLLLSGVMCFIVALILVRRGEGPFAAAALVLIVNVPVFIGVFAGMYGSLSALRAVALSVGTPKPSEVVAIVVAVLLGPLLGILLALPGYAVAASGAYLRAIRSDAERNDARFN